MNRIDDDPLGLNPDKPTVPARENGRGWHDLKRLAPALAKYESRNWRSQRIPRPLSDPLFASLVACLSHREKREILRALLLDLLADDIIEIVVGMVTEDDE